MSQIKKQRYKTNTITYNQRRILCKVSGSTLPHVVRTIEKYEAGKKIRQTFKQHLIITAYKIFKSYNEKAIDKVSAVCENIHRENSQVCV